MSNVDNKTLQKENKIQGGPQSDVNSYKCPLLMLLYLVSPVHYLRFIPDFKFYDNAKPICHRDDRQTDKERVKQVPDRKRKTIVSSIKFKEVRLTKVDRLPTNWTVAYHDSI